MPVYPNYVLVSLQEINGNSCGTVEQRCELVPNADPPEYNRTEEGDLPLCNLKQITLTGGVITWDMTIARWSGACAGIHFFRRSEAADDPTGNYCKRSGSVVNCSWGKAAAVDDD